MYSKLSTDSSITRLLLLEVRHIFLCRAIEEWVLLMENQNFSQTSIVEYITNLYIKDTEFSESDYKSQHFGVGTVRLCLQMNGLVPHYLKPCLRTKSHSCFVFLEILVLNQGNIK